MLRFCQLTAQPAPTSEVLISLHSDHGLVMSCTDILHRITCVTAVGHHALVHHINCVSCKLSAYKACEHKVPAFVQALDLYRQLLAAQDADPLLHTFAAACLYYIGLYDQAEAAANEVDQLANRQLSLTQPPVSCWISMPDC